MGVNYQQEKGSKQEKGVCTGFLSHKYTDLKSVSASLLLHEKARGSTDFVYLVMVSYQIT